MISLQNYFAKGFGIAAITLILVLGVYILVKCVPSLEGKNSIRLCFLRRCGTS